MGQLNRETTSQYQLTVQAEDWGPPSRTSTATLTVNIGGSCHSNTDIQTTTTRTSTLTTRSRQTTISTSPTKSPPTTGRPSSGRIECRATGSWSGDKGMDEWCNDGCNQPTPYCPPNLCS